MAHKAKAFALYPGWILDVIQRMGENGEAYVALDMSDRATATSSAHMFNRGKLAYVRERIASGSVGGSVGDSVERVLDIVARVTNLNASDSGKSGRYLLEFTRRGLAILADEKRGVVSKFRGENAEDADGLPNFEEASRASNGETIAEFAEQLNRSKASDPMEEMLERMIAKRKDGEAK